MAFGIGFPFGVQGTGGIGGIITSTPGVDLPDFTGTLGLLDGGVGTTYSVNVAALNTGGLIASYSLNGTLPAGLVLNTSTGYITGTTTTAATYSGYSISGTNASGTDTTNTDSVVISATDWNYMYSLDAEGWSILPDPDSAARMIYVSANSGDDSTGRTYTPAQLDDINDPSVADGSALLPYATIEEGSAQLRNDTGDRLLLKRGEEWEPALRTNLRAGESLSSPMVIMGYGTSTTRPVIKSGILGGFRNNNLKNVVYLGIEIYAHIRDPANDDFAGFGNVDGGTGISITSGNPSSNFLIEDCVIKYCGGGIIAQGKIGTSNEIQNIQIRRNQILNSYGTDSHSQGMLLASVNGVLLEECLLDHNGWHQQSYDGTDDAGQATVFNHNAYFENVNNSVIRNNINSNSSSIGWKSTANPTGGTDVVASSNYKNYDNLVVGSEIVASAGGNTDYGDGYRFANVQFSDNVAIFVGYNNPTNREVAIGIDADDWNEGFIKDCYFLFTDLAVSTGASQGIYREDYQLNTVFTGNYAIDYGDDIIRTVNSSSANYTNVTTSGNIDITSVSNPFNRNDLNSYLGLTLSSTDRGIDALLTLAKAQRKGSWNTAYTAKIINAHLIQNTVDLDLVAPVFSGTFAAPDADIGDTLSVDLRQFFRGGDGNPTSYSFQGTQPSGLSISGFMLTGTYDTGATYAGWGITGTNSVSSSNSNTITTVIAAARKFLSFGTSSYGEISPDIAVGPDTDISLSFRALNPLSGVSIPLIGSSAGGARHVSVSDTTLSIRYGTTHTFTIPTINDFQTHTIAYSRDAAGAGTLVYDGVAVSENTGNTSTYVGDTVNAINKYAYVSSNNVIIWDVTIRNGATTTKYNIDSESTTSESASVGSGTLTFTGVVSGDWA
jgi:hypothetical protein